MADGRYWLLHDAEDVDDTIDEVVAARGDSASLSARLADIVSDFDADQQRQDTEISTKITLADIFGVGTIIADNTDLDTLTAIGKYYGGNSAGNTVLHLPVENGSFTFSLEVRQATPSMTYQYLRICRLADDPYIYIRRKYTTWGTWYRFTGEAVAAVQSAPASLMQAGRIDEELTDAGRIDAEQAAAETEEEADA